jgi:LysM repeat protein
VKAPLCIVAALLAASPLLAQERPAEPPQDRVHVVRQGDTLWDIARRYLDDPFLWPEIFRLNTDVVRNPARIYPQERLRLPGTGGVMYVTEEVGPRRTVFFPRDDRTDYGPRHTVRAAGTADIPVLAPGDFYRAGFLARDREVRAVGRLAERLFPSVVATDLPAHIQLYDRVYVALAAGAATAAGDRLHFYRPDRVVRQHGRIFRPTGIATVAAVEGGVATAVIVQVFDAMTVGDLALPLAQFPVPSGVQPVADQGPRAAIVAFQSENVLYMPEDVAFLDVGAASGVREGDEFAAYLPAQRRGWGVRPQVEVARLQVVRVEERTAAARVVTLEYPALEPGLSVRRVARMP